MRISDLIDIYGVLLSENRRNIIELYYNEDYSLSEIAEQCGISRQGVRDSIKKSELELIDYENRLHLLEKTEREHEIFRQITSLLKAEESTPNIEKVLKLLETLNGN